MSKTRINQHRCYTRIDDDGKTTFKCVCGAVGAKTSSVGLWDVDVTSFKPKNVHMRHRCPCHPLALINRRVLFVFEPLNGFESDGIWKLPEGEALAGSARRIADQLNLRVPEQIICETVLFSSIDDFESRLAALAKEYAFYETFFVIVGHGTEIGSLIVDGHDNTCMSPLQMIGRINRFYTPSACLKHARVSLVYFAYCNSAFSMDNEAFRDGMQKAPQSFAHSSIVGVHDELCANNFDLIDCFWLLQALLSKSPLLCIDTSVSKLHLIPEVRKHVVISPHVDEEVELNRVFPECTEEARKYAIFHVFDGESPMDKTIFDGLSEEDGMVKR